MGCKRPAAAMAKPISQTKPQQPPTVICGSCMEAKPKTEYRPGAEACKACQLIKCVSCGKEKDKTNYNVTDVHNFFSHRKNVFCQTCRQTGASFKNAPHKTYNKKMVRGM